MSILTVSSHPIPSSPSSKSLKSIGIHLVLFPPLIHSSLFTSPPRKSLVLYSTLLYSTRMSVCLSFLNFIPRLWIDLRRVHTYPSLEYGVWSYVALLARSEWVGLAWPGSGTGTGLVLVCLGGQASSGEFEWGVGGVFLEEWRLCVCMYVCHVDGCPALLCDALPCFVLPCFALPCSVLFCSACFFLCMYVCTE